MMKIAKILLDLNMCCEDVAKLIDEYSCTLVVFSNNAIIKFTDICYEQQRKILIYLDSITSDLIYYYNSYSIGYTIYSSSLISFANTEKKKDRYIKFHSCGIIYDKINDRYINFNFVLDVATHYDIIQYIDKYKPTKFRLKTIKN